MPNRVAIFIDGAYLVKVLQEEFPGGRIDFQKLSESLAGGAEILRTYYYNSPAYQGNPPTQEQRERYASQRRFFNILELLPRYKVRLGRLAYRGEDATGNSVFEQKQVGILLSVDLVQLAAKRVIQEAVIVAGDSDFIPAIAAAQSEAVVVRLFHGANPHADLLREVDERYQFTPEFMDSVRLVARTTDG